MGHSLLSQFPHLEFTYHQRSFIDTEDKARELVAEIYEVAEDQGFKPLVFATMPETNINEILASANCHYYEIFESFLDKIGHDLHTEPTRESGLSHGMINAKTYDARIDALKFHPEDMMNANGI
ncbi:UNVERIFIED_CONTAM: hypothetical protein GTU68_038586 [Idotea baltica]|nr:hypothetical protein [Idotea baltica]